MDVRITKQNGGEATLLSEINVVAQDFIVSSIELLPSYGSVEGRSGTVDYGASYGTRTITVPFYLEASGSHDYHLIRDRLFELVTDFESFYIEELRFNEFETGKNEFVGGKRYLVRLNNVIDLDQQFKFGFGEMEFVTTELPFAESIGTTAEIDTGNLIPYADLSVPANYEYWVAIGNTSFSTTSPVSYEGYSKSFLRVTAPSASPGANRRVRSSNKMRLVNGRDYEVSFIGATSDWLDSSFNYTGILRTTGNFATNGNLSSRIDKKAVGEADISGFTKTIYKYNVTYTHEDVTGNYSLMIGTKQTREQSAYFLITEPSIKPMNKNDFSGMWGFGMGLLSEDKSKQYRHSVSSSSSFYIYNAGNVAVHPFEQDLKITISDVVGSTSLFQITNETNASRFRITEEVPNSDTYVYDGPNVTRNGLQALRRTRRDFIYLSPGWNELQMHYADSATVEFDFRYYYK